MPAASSSSPTVRNIHRSSHLRFSHRTSAVCTSRESEPQLLALTTTTQYLKLTSYQANRTRPGHTSCRPVTRFPRPPWYAYYLTYLPTKCLYYAQPQKGRIPASPSLGSDRYTIAHKPKHHRAVDMVDVALNWFSTSMIYYCELFQRISTPKMHVRINPRARPCQLSHMAPSRGSRPKTTPTKDPAYALAGWWRFQPPAAHACLAHAGNT